MFGSITKLFSGLIGGLVSLLTLPLKLFSGKGQKTADGKSAKPKAKEAFFLEESDAKGFSEPAPKAAAKKAPAAAPVAVNTATAAALNLPQPTVTTPAAPAYKQFGPARRPGANMKSYLDMAKTMKKA